MNIYIYADESGVFDPVHVPRFIYAGIIVFSNEEKNKVTGTYLGVENEIRKNYHIKGEVKASKVHGKTKLRLFKCLKNVYKFAIIIESRKLNPKIFENKKHKQRYLDYAFKIVLKHFFKEKINQGILDPSKVCNIIINADEHSTATDSRYELKELMYNEFKNGTFNLNYNIYFDPLFPLMNGGVEVNFCNSSSTVLVRCADIVANNVAYLARNKNEKIIQDEFMFIDYLP